MTFAENIGFGLKLGGTPKAEVDARVKDVAQILQLTKLLDRKLKAISGGQRQRVAMGRAIVRKPRALLFDDLLSSPGTALRAQMRVELAELHERIGATMVYVTHDHVEAMTLADQIVVLNGGRIEQVGAPMHLYGRPATPFVAGFFGSPKINFLEGAAAQALGGNLVCIRPEHIDITTEGLLRGTLKHAEHLGSEMLSYVDVPDVGVLTVKSEGDARPTNDQHIGLSARSGCMHVFGAT